MDENVDQGVTPIDAFESICECCAIDLEDFIYDFIADQIDTNNDNYALELLDGFYPYMRAQKWFDFLKVRLVLNKDVLDGNRLLRKLVEETAEEEDIQFNLELLSSMVEGGERSLFVKLVQSTLALVQVEEDFQELLTACADYCQRLDLDWEEREIQNILDQRQTRLLDAELERNDPHKVQFISVLQSRDDSFA